MRASIIADSIYLTGGAGSGHGFGFSNEFLQEIMGAVRMTVDEVERSSNGAG